MEPFASILQQPAGAITIGFVAAAVPAFLLLRRMRQQRARELQASETAAVIARRNELIVDASGEGIFELDMQGRVRFANPAALRMSGYSSEELLGLD
jgi:PAS domain-containing protein